MLRRNSRALIVITEATVGAAAPYRAHISFRLSNVWLLVIHHNVRRSGYATASRTAKLIAAAIDKSR